MSLIPAVTDPPLVLDMKLPLLLSVPHAGEWIPAEVEDICVLTHQEIVDDGDKGARVLYDHEELVAGFVAANVARAIVDVNRAEDDFRKDGIVKTHTCWDIPVYRSAPSEGTVKKLIEKYYLPYHNQLRDLASGDARLGVDCHTMAAAGPPVGPDAGRERPHLCLSNGDGTLPPEWLKDLAGCLASAFGFPPSINDPFKGGYIIRSHSAEIPWVQLEVSRGPFLAIEEKKQRILEAFQCFFSLH